jgi:hypothetical protein
MVQRYSTAVLDACTPVQRCSVSHVCCSRSVTCCMYATCAQCCLLLCTAPAAALLLLLLLQVGDGTTTVVILSGEFLREAKPFVEEGVHPRVRQQLQWPNAAAAAAAVDSRADDSSCDEGSASRVTSGLMMLHEYGTHALMLVCWYGGCYGSCHRRECARASWNNVEPPSGVQAGSARSMHVQPHSLPGQVPAPVASEPPPAPSPQSIIKSCRQACSLRLHACSHPCTHPFLCITCSFPKA